MAFPDNLADIARAFLGDATNQSAAASGFMKLPNGLAIQWGQTTVASSGATSGSQTVTLPTSFANNCLQVITGGQSVGTPAKAFLGSTPIDKASFSLRWSVGAAGDMTGGTVATWIAFGN